MELMPQMCLFNNPEIISQTSLLSCYLLYKFIIISSYLSDQCIGLAKSLLRFFCNISRYRIQHSRPLANGPKFISLIWSPTFPNWVTLSHSPENALLFQPCSHCSLLRITSWFTPLHHCHFFPFDQRLSFISFIIHNVFLYEGLDSLLTNTVIMFYFDSFSSWGWINIPRTKVPFMFLKMPRGAYEWIVPFLSSMFTQKTILYSTHTLCLSFWSFLHHPTLAILKYSEIKSFTQRKNFHGPEFLKCSIFKENYLYFNLWYLKVWEVFFRSPPTTHHQGQRKGTI